MISKLISLKLNPKMMDFFSSVSGAAYKQLTFFTRASAVASLNLKENLLLKHKTYDSI